ncbi:hypothetical protein LCGC14_2928500 [marine sediment metagenome]|uniref:DUF3850 domain-containing protein n=1 Tax=marine sediment metagenome TaxID=412755 RepID=A0A0F8XLP7_9ZZZZ
MTIHFLKTDHETYRNMESGEKTFDYRKNDRDFKVRDKVTLRDYFPDIRGRYTQEYDVYGSSIDFEITYILYGGKYGLPDNYCIMQLKRLRGMYYG